MRGWLNLLTKLGDVRTYRTGIFVASAEPDVMAKVLPEIYRRFPHVSFTFLTSRVYTEQTSWMSEAFNKGKTLWIEAVKSHPIRSLVTLRKQRFDLCVVVWPGRRTFLTSKVAVFFLNARKIIAYNENGDSFPIDRTNGRYILAHARCRLNKFPSESFFYPLGFTYLLGRTLWLYARSKGTGHIRDRSERPTSELL